MFAMIINRLSGKMEAEVGAGKGGEGARCKRTSGACTACQEPAAPSRTVGVLTLQTGSLFTLNYA